MECRLRELREKRGFTQREIAAMLDVSQQTVSRVESGTGKIPIELAVKAAYVFQVSVEYFLCLPEYSFNGKDGNDLLLKAGPHMDFLKEYLKLGSEDKKNVRNLVHNLKELQDMGGE